MSGLEVFLFATIGFITAWALIPFIRQISARTGAMEQARQFHQTHTKPVPRLGGIALAGAFTVISAVALTLFPIGVSRHESPWAVMAGALLMFALGLTDDLRPLGARKKLLLQTLISTATYSWGVQIELLRNPFTGGTVVLGLAGFVATVVWLVVMTNLINLIDGIDGLAGGIGFMLMCLLAYVGWGVNLSYPTIVAVGMAGALLGFLYYNFPPARIYMGDGGAYFLGFLIGALTIVNSHKGTVVAALIAPLFALALPIADVALAIFRRWLSGLPIFRPDRKHIHHRLLHVGFSRRRAVLSLYVVSSLFVLMAFGIFWSQGRLVPVLFGVAFFLLILSARSFGFVQDWLAFRSVLGGAFQLRKDVRYALALGRWLELEAERCESLDALWEGFTFLSRKLGFSGVKILLEDGGRSWTKQPPSDETMEAFRQRFEFTTGRPMTFEFEARPATLNRRAFELMCELAAESWTKASMHWCGLTRLPLRFDAVCGVENIKAANPDKLISQKAANSEKMALSKVNVTP